MLSPYAAFYLQVLINNKNVFWEMTVKRRSLAVFSTVVVTVWLLWNIDVKGKKNNFHFSTMSENFSILVIKHLKKYNPRPPFVYIAVSLHVYRYSILLYLSENHNWMPFFLIHSIKNHIYLCISNLCKQWVVKMKILG